MSQLNQSVTVGIPTYKGCRTLIHTVESVVEALNKLTTAQKEIIICVNGELKETLNTAKLCHLRYPNLVRIFCRHESSKALAMNTIVKYANGSIIFFIDDDVHLDRHCLQLSYVRLSSNPQIKLVFSERQIIESVKGNIFRSFLYKCLSIRYRRQIYNRPDEFVNGSCMGIRRTDYPWLPLDIINDDQYMHILFWGNVSKVSEAIHFFYGISSVKQYCRRHHRINNGRPQMYSYFDSERIQLYEQLINRSIDLANIKIFSLREKTQFKIWRFIDWISRQTYRLPKMRHKRWTRNSHDHQSWTDSFSEWKRAV